MKARTYAVRSWKSLLLAVTLNVMVAVPLWANSATTTMPVPTSMAHVQSAYGHLPLSFEANYGQWDPSVQFVTRGSGHQLFLRPSDAVLDLRMGDAKGEGRESDIRQRQVPNIPTPGSHSVVRMRFDGANPQAELVGLERLPGIVNYIIGEDPAKWRTHIPTYQKVEYQDVYPGIDLVYYGNQGQLEYDFIVAPGADPKQITLAFEGVETIDVDQQGDLVLTLQKVMDIAGGNVATLRMHKPVVYQQDAHGHKHLLSGSYVLLAAESSSHRSTATFTHSSETAHVAFQVASYDASQPLIIDPVLSWATYLGGSGDEFATAIAVDQSGQIYVTGAAGMPQGAAFPGTAGSMIQSTFGGGSYDVFVVKYNATGTAPVYTTYLGGSGEDQGGGIVVDHEGQVYVVGKTDTRGSGFPGTASSLIQSTFRGGTYDAFVLKLNAGGTALIYATYLGSSEDDAGGGIAIDLEGQAYVTGVVSLSVNFPGAAGSLIQSSFGGGGTDAFVAKLNPTGTALIYSTYLGPQSTFGQGIAVDQLGSAYVTGYINTPRSGFPVTTNSPIQSTFGGGVRDAFVAKLNPAGTGLVYATYLGGSGDESGQEIAVDQAGQAYVIGLTNSSVPGFPGTAGSLIQNTFGGGENDAFVAKLNSAGTALIYATYLGGSGDESGNGIAVDQAGNAYVTGYTRTLGSGFPGTAGSLLQSTSGGGADAFIAKITSNLPFAAFKPKAEIDWRQLRSDTFQLKASFTLSPSSNGINPLTEAVTVQVGSFATTIPAGSFKLKKGRYVFEGVINGVKLEAVLRSMILGNDYEFTVEGKGVEFSKTEDVVTVGLTIGDDSGSQTITAIIK